MHLTLIFRVNEALYDKINIIFGIYASKYIRIGVFLCFIECVCVLLFICMQNFFRGLLHAVHMGGVPPFQPTLKTSKEGAAHCVYCMQRALIFYTLLQFPTKHT